MLYKKLLQCVVFVLSVLASGVQAEQIMDATQKKVLIVISGNAQQEKNSHNGYEFDEFAKAYLVFKENQVKVIVTSPQGGKVAPSQFDKNRDFNATVLADETAMQLLEKSVPFSSINADEYDAVFVVGGNGAMFDLPENRDLQKIIATIYESDGVVSAVCHGPAALVNVKLSNGSYLVSGKKVNAFTNNEENIVNQEGSANYKFLIETKLKQRNAYFESSPLLMSHSVSDSRLVTGQNQHSTGETVSALLTSLGLKNVKVPAFKDEESMAIVRRVLAGDNNALKYFHRTPQNYLPKLMAMYATVYARSAKKDKDIIKAVVLMEAAMQYFQHPRLSLSLANNLLKLKRTTQAKNIVADVLVQNPDNTKAKKLLTKIIKLEKSV